MQPSQHEFRVLAYRQQYAFSSAGIHSSGHYKLGSCGAIALPEQCREKQVSLYTYRSENIQASLSDATYAIDVSLFILKQQICALFALLRSGSFWLLTRCRAATIKLIENMNL